MSELHSVMYPESFWADRYIYQIHKGTTMVDDGFQNCAFKCSKNAPFVSLFFASVCIFVVKSFRNNKMHYEIIGHYFHVFFIEIQLKKQNLKIIIWAPEFRRSNQYTSLPNDLDTSLALRQYYKRYIITIILIEKVNLNFFTLLMSSQISRES